MRTIGNDRVGFALTYAGTRRNGGAQTAQRSSSLPLDAASSAANRRNASSSDGSRRPRSVPSTLYGGLAAGSPSAAVEHSSTRSSGYPSTAAVRRASSAQLT